MNRVLLSIAALVALFCIIPAHAQSYKLSDIGYLGDNPASTSVAESLSPTGEVGGYSGDTFLSGYVWQNGVISALPDLPGSVGDTRVFGINSAGIAVGACSDYFNPFNYAVRWQNGAVTDLGSLGGGTNGGAALAINDSGTIAGFSFATDRLGSPEVAAYYDTAWHALPYLTGAPSDAYAEAHAINASGECAGESTASDGQYHATLWKGGKAYDLGLLGGTSSQAGGMNDAGMVVGYFQTQPDANGITYDHAFLWTPTSANGTSGTMKDLGTLPGGTDSIARDINNNNQIVGYGSNGPFLWDAAHGMRSLNDLVTSAQLNPTPDAYYMNDAVAINDNGQIAGDFTEVFVGSGDISHGCFLDPGAGNAAAKAKALTLAPNPVVGGQNVTGTVTLTAPAPAAQTAGGAVVTITENGATLGTVTVPAGATTATFTLNTSAVTATETDTLGAVYGGATVTTTLTITPAAGTVTVQSLSVSPASVAGGTSSTGTLTLTGPAPAGGLAVTLKSSDTSAATVSSTLNVAAGATSAKFKITTKAVTSTQTVTITATAGGTSKTATLTVTSSAPAVTISTLVLTPTSVTAGQTSSGKITLSAVAPTGGATITLKSSDTASATVPVSVTIAAGNKSISFTVTSKSVTSTRTITITATVGSSSKAATLTVTPSTGTVTAKSLTATPPSVSSNGQTACVVTLSGAAPAGGASVPVTLNGAAFYTATVAAGQTSTSFNVNWGVVSSTSTNTLSAAYGGKTVIATVTVSPTTVTLKSYTFSPNPITGGQTATAKVTLSAAAPAGGAVITIDYNGAYFYQFVIPAGATSGTYPQPTNTSTSAYALVFVANYNGASLSKTLTVNP